jgi:hypothetical protein
MFPIPHEFNLGGIFMPPLLIASFFGLLSAVATAQLLNHYHLSRYFFYPPLVLVSLAVIYTIIIGTFLLGT